MICPSCHNDEIVTAHSFGALFTCPSCQAVYFINFEGQPEYGEMLELETAPELGASPLPPTNLPDAIQSADSSPFENPLPFENLAAFEMPSPVEVRSPFSDVAKDISDYGNSETQIAHLNYDLQISGLDSAEVFGLFKEAIDDSRFGWDASELIRSVKSGAMKFEKLNPVKAYILSKRLQFLDIEKVWKQNAVG